jgi:L-cysteine:1D-myo-inositol 2-amino-2-deoxy-alpha-D-glucopyranoside ligase
MLARLPRPRPWRDSGDAALLHIYDSLTRRAEPFEPIEDRLVRMYVCGITPYDVGHMGHASTYVFFDVVRRYLEFNSYDVLHIQNITDVDDDMVRKSKELGVAIADLTEQNHAVFLREMDALNVLRPLAYPRVSEHIPQIVEMVEALLARGAAYIANRHVFFDSSCAPGFGALSGMSISELRSAPRTDTMPEEPEELKRDPLDFLLWQPSTDEGATFPSPWGPGRPGWHIECSAMARATLGERIDIHGGGQDLKYPHHDSEIAQSECATGQAPFVRTWMHTGTVTIGGVKMSKSLGNLVKVSDLLARGHTPDAIRLTLLSRRYREEHPWDEAELDAWEARAAGLTRAALGPGGPPDSLRVEPRRLAFMDALDEDFDTPKAIGVLLRIATDIEARRLSGTTAIPTLRELAGVLGLRLGGEQ